MESTGFLRGLPLPRPTIAVAALGAADTWGSDLAGGRDGVLTCCLFAGGLSGLVPELPLVFLPCSSAKNLCLASSSIAASCSTMRGSIPDLRESERFRVDAGALVVLINCTICSGVSGASSSRGFGILKDSISFALLTIPVKGLPPSSMLCSGSVTGGGSDLPLVLDRDLGFAFAFAFEFGAVSRSLGRPLCIASVAIIGS